MLFDAIMQVFGQEEADRPLTAQQSTDAEARARAALTGARVLLVEDNDINRQVAGEILASVGVSVSMAANGQEAVDAVVAGDFDAVLMDVQMPVMDGYEATRRLRRKPRFQALPIIAMTAHAMAGDREKSLAAGMNDHVTKPIDPEALFRTLEHHVAKPEARTAAAPAPPVTAPPAPPSGAAPLPPLDGIDTAQGVKRLLGNQTVYVNILRKFGEDFKAAAETLQEHGRGGERAGRRHPGPHHQGGRRQPRRR